MDYVTGVCTQMVDCWSTGTFSSLPSWSLNAGSVTVDPEEEAMKKFFRQLFKDPIEHDLVEEYFEFNPTSLLLALFHREEMVKTIRCIKSERIRKEDIDYENKVQMMSDEQASGEDIESVLE